MITRAFFSLAVAALLMSGVASAAPLAINKSDTTASVLAAQKGNRVTIKLQSGEELSGKVVAVGDSVVQLGELAGREFFDAVIPISSVGAVIVRTRE
ncbi:MAG: hypothetical protein HYR49_02935 [Gammaproteobacteria bacterium]|nr:hypothetical protein [Gammaproteobacteria bacterium]